MATAPYSTPDPGQLYALTNDYMPGLLKVGKTSRSVADRARELSTTGVPGDFEVVWESRRLANVSAAERRAHAALKGQRARGEFFKLSLQQALPMLSEIEEEFLDTVWAHREAERRAREEAEHRRLESVRRRLSLELDGWLTSPDVQEAFQRAAAHPPPDSSEGLFGCALVFSMPLVGLMLSVVLTPIGGGIGALLFAGWALQAYRERRERLGEQAGARRAEVWLPLKSRTPPAIWTMLERHHWLTSTPEELRQRLLV